MMKRFAILPATFAAASVWAHGGHAAASEFHWHATDTFGLLLVVMLGGLALWFAGRK